MIELNQKRHSQIGKRSYAEFLLPWYLHLFFWFNIHLSENKEDSERFFNKKYITNAIRANEISPNPL